MKIKSWILVISMITILLTAVGCGSTTTPSTGGTTATQPPAAVTEAQPATQPPAAAALDGKALVQERCTVCHSIDRIQNAKKTADEWKSTVDRMIGKGAKLNADEATAVVDYLSKTFGK